MELGPETERKCEDECSSLVYQPGLPNPRTLYNRHEVSIKQRLYSSDLKNVAPSPSEDDIPSSSGHCERRGARVSNSCTMLPKIFLPKPVCMQKWPMM